MSDVHPAYTIAELKKLFRCGIGTIKELMRTQQLHAFKVGNAWRVSYEEVEDFKRRNEIYLVGNLSRVVTREKLSASADEYVYHPGDKVV